MRHSLLVLDRSGLERRKLKLQLARKLEGPFGGNTPFDHGGDRMALVAAVGLVFSESHSYPTKIRPPCSALVLLEKRRPSRGTRYGTVAWDKMVEQAETKKEKFLTRPSKLSGQPEVRHPIRICNHHSRQEEERPTRREPDQNTAHPKTTHTPDQAGIARNNSPGVRRPPSVSHRARTYAALKIA